MNDETAAKERQFLDTMVQDSLTIQLTTLQSKLNRHAAKVLSGSGLTLLEWRVLFVLNMLDTATLSQINRITGIDRGQLSRTISRLSVQGLVAAQVPKHDLRNRILAMTAKGQQKYRSAEQAMTKRREDFQGVLSAQELEVFLANLQRLHGHFDDALKD